MESQGEQLGGAAPRHRVAVRARAEPRAHHPPPRTRTRAVARGGRGRDVEDGRAVGPVPVAAQVEQVPRHACAVQPRDGGVHSGPHLACRGGWGEERRGMGDAMRGVLVGG